MAEIGRAIAIVWHVFEINATRFRYNTLGPASWDSLALRTALLRGPFRPIDDGPGQVSFQCLSTSPQLGGTSEPVIVQRMKRVLPMYDTRAVIARPCG